MELERNDVERIVTEVLQEVQKKNASPEIIKKSPGEGMGIFPSVSSAIPASRKAQETLLTLKLEVRENIIKAIRETALQYTEQLASMTLEDTGMGRYEDKIKKIHIAALRTPGLEDLKTESFSGDHGLTIVERSAYGVISSVTPSTHPVPTLINNAISMIAGGNSIFFNPHPAGKRVFKYTVTLLNQAIADAGGPENLITCLGFPTIETTQESFAHKDVDLIVVTGGPGVVMEALKYPKRVIGAGPGNPPVVVDETADLKKAACSIVEGGTFDNNIFCTSEKEIFVVDSVADELKKELLNYKCHELSSLQIDHLAEQAVTDPGAEHPVMNRKLVGRNASVLAEAVGLKVDDDIRFLIGETAPGHIFVRAEQLMPFMPLVRVKNVDEAIQMAIKYEHGFRHSAIMHSLNLKSLDKMAKLSGVTIFVKNGPSYAGLGVGGQGSTSYTIAGTTGEGITTASTFTRKRRCVLVDYFRIV
ncbi:MAG: aldehyde dehydrogenase EutE [Spirochaetes bacterium]|nr:aldehyde dehydrogenase EutE [Spirochaetota bacterium]